MRICIVLSLAYLLAGAACAKPPPILLPVEGRRASPCIGIDAEVAKFIDARLAHLGRASSFDDAERVGAELAQKFDLHPCEFVTKAIDAGLTDKEIARIISTIPVAFVDRPCARRERLQVRMGSLHRSRAAEVRTESIRAFLQVSLRRDARECRRRGGGSHNPVAWPVPVDASLEGMKFLSWR